MVRPLYPPKKKEPPSLLWKKTQLVFTMLLIIVLAAAFVFHFHSSRIIDLNLLPGEKSSSNVFSFLKPSKYFKSYDRAAEIQNQKLKEMGINESVDALKNDVKAKDLREQRRILAMRKYEAAREIAEKRQQRKEELLRKLSTPISLQLKDAIVALEASDNLGIIKLERLIKEKLLTRGASSEDLDVIIFAYDLLAKAYEEKQMYDKAKEAYVNLFKLMKTKAPDSQEPEWDKAISEVEQMNTKVRNN